MRYQVFGRSIKAVLLLVLAGAAAAAQDNAADVARLIEVLGIRPGSIVADIGAGDGVLTIPIARAVGVTGRVYATDLGGAPLEGLRKALAAAHPANVEIVEA